LKQFSAGCPARKWNGTDGCPAWVEVDMLLQNGQEKVQIRECLDLYQARLGYDTNRLLEGVQQCIQSFRNGMVFTAPDGSAHPKPDPAVAKLAMIAASGGKMLPGA